MNNYYLSIKLFIFPYSGDNTKVTKVFSMTSETNYIYDFQ